MATVADLEKRLDRQEERIDVMEKNQSNLNEKIIRLDAKMDSFGKEQKTIYDVVKEIQSDMKNHLLKPIKMFDSIYVYIVTCIIGIVLGYIASLII